MSVLITMEVGPAEWEKLKAAEDWSEGALSYSAGENASGHISTKVYRSHDNPTMFLILEEWESQAAFDLYFGSVKSELISKVADHGNVEWRNRAWVLA